MLRWGIIGCGNVTEVKSGPGLQKADGSELVAVMRRDGALAEDYAKRHSVAKWYDNAEALIADPEVNAIYIATPPANHLEFAKAAALAGKTVYVEKPMARTGSECDQMIDTCKEANVPLYVAYYRRALPRFRKVKELLASGVIGDIRVVHTHHMSRPSEAELKGSSEAWRIRPDISGGGHFVDVGSHTLDLLDELLGPIAEVTGFAANQAGLYEAEDIVTASYTFASGVQGSGIWCFSAFAYEEWNEIVGSLGSIRFSTFAETPVILTKIGRAHV